MNAAHHSHRWKAYLHDCGELIAIVEPMQVSGRVTRVAGLVMEAVGLKLAVGSACTVPLPNGAQLEAEVVGFEGDRLFLMPQSEVEGIVPGSRVFPAEISATLPGLGQVKHPRRRPSDRTRHLPVGDALLGRVIDSSGRPLDGLWRAPGGYTTQRAIRWAANCGWPLHVHWDAAGFIGDELPSEQYPNDKLLKQALASIKPGTVTMMHLGIWPRKEPLAPILEPLIQGLKARGLCFAPLAVTQH